MEAEERCGLVLAEEETKANKTIEKELVAMKRNFNEAEDEYKYKISRLTQQLEQLKDVDSSVNNRQNKVNKEKEDEISRLEVMIKKGRDDYLEMVDEKNK